MISGHAISPVDVRTLAERHRAIVDGRLTFDRQVEGRAKSGRAAIGTISRRTERLVSEYLDELGQSVCRMRSCFGIDPAIPIAPRTLALNGTRPHSRLTLSQSPPLDRRPAAPDARHRLTQTRPDIRSVPR